MNDMLGEVNAETICAASREKLQSCGITFKRADYIKSFADKTDSGEFVLMGNRRRRDTGNA